jgi:hypothetical protein
MLKLLVMRVTSTTIGPENDVRVSCKGDALELTYTEPRKTPNENSATSCLFIVTHFNYSN